MLKVGDKVRISKSPIGMFAKDIAGKICEIEHVCESDETLYLSDQIWVGFDDVEIIAKEDEDYTKVIYEMIKTRASGIDRNLAASLINLLLEN
jgi:hypothetical protein